MKKWITWSFSASLILAFQNCSDAFKESPLYDEGSLDSSALSSTLSPWSNSSLILAQPLTTIGYEGQPVFLNVEAKSLAGATYQWLKGGMPVYGATSKTFSLNLAAPSDTGLYSVLVTDSSGRSEQSQSVYLQIQPAPSALLAPEITTQPQSITERVGASIVLQVGVAGYPAPTWYQWYKDGQALVGQNKPYLRLDAVTAADSGDYAMAVVNPAAPEGRGTNHALVSVK